MVVVLSRPHFYLFAEAGPPPLPVILLHPLSVPRLMVMDAPPPVDGNDAPAPPRGPVRTAVDLAVDVVGRPAAEAVKPAVTAFKDAYPRGGSVVDDVARTVGGAAERVTTVADEAIAQRVQRYVCFSALLGYERASRGYTLVCLPFAGLYVVDWEGRSSLFL